MGTRASRERPAMTIVGAFKVQGVPVLIGDMALMKGEIRSLRRKAQASLIEKFVTSFAWLALRIAVSVSSICGHRVYGFLKCPKKGPAGGWLSRSASGRLWKINLYNLLYFKEVRLAGTRDWMVPEVSGSESMVGRVGLEPTTNAVNTRWSLALASAR